MFQNRLPKILILLTLIPAGITGCVSTNQPDRIIRQRSIDRFASALKKYDPYYGFGLLDSTHFQDFSERIISAESTHEYLRAWAALLAELDDPHVHVVGEEFQKRWDLTDFTPAVRKLWPTGGRWYVLFREDAVPKSSSKDAKPIDASRFYDVIAIDDVPITYSTHAILAVGPANQEFTVTVVDEYGDRVQLAAVYPATSEEDRGEPPPTLQQEGGLKILRVSTVDVDGDGESDASGDVGFSILPGNIGYIMLNSTEDDRVVKEFDGALDILDFTHGLILDLRDNSGGSIDACAEIAGRFVASRKALFYMQVSPEIVPIDAAVDRRIAYYISPRGKTYHKPVVVITSGMTASGGEHLAYFLSSRRQATIVGDSTVGAAGAASLTLLLPCGLDLRMSVHPLSLLASSGFQSLGLIPDVSMRPDRLDILKGGEAYFGNWSERVLGSAHRIASKKATEFAEFKPLTEREPVLDEESIEVLKKSLID